MDTSTTLQYVNKAYYSGFLSIKVQNIGSRSNPPGEDYYVDQLNTIMHNHQFKNIFIRDLCDELNSRNLLLTGVDHDVKIIAEYACANMVD